MDKTQNDNSTEIKERFKTLITDDLRKELEDNIRSIANQLINEQIFNGKNGHLNNNNNKHDPKRSKHSNEKIFTPRDSLLTELLEITHIRTIYHICVVILILLFLNTVIYDLVDKGSINIGLGLIMIGFGKFERVICIWGFMQSAAYLPYYVLNIWRKLPMNRLNNIIGIICYVTFQLLLCILPIIAVVKFQLPIASSFVILSEMIRFMMKSHAYIRSIVPRILENPLSPLPTFSWYVYFLFAPTLIYRDSYPRTKKIEWNKVISRVFEVVAVIFYINFLCERFLIRNWSKFGSPTEIFEAKEMVVILFGSMLPALLMFLCGFYLLLHSWHNATAEILTFADRRFYLDWWNQSDYGSYYRTWNMIVHDWLHTYVYQDAIRLTGNKGVGTFFVFLISAIFHEILLTFAFGFFYPVLLVLFGGAGVLLMFITKQLNLKVGNILLWLTLTIGNGVLWSMYGAEYFARVNCQPTTDNYLLDLIIPRSWFCHTVIFTPNWKLQNPFNIE